MAKQDDYVRYTIRVPAALYESVRLAAGDKSVNAEVVERLYSSFNKRDPGITISLEVLPFGSKPEKVSLGTFLTTFAHTISAEVESVRQQEKAERRAEREAARNAGPTLSAPDLDSSKN